MIANKGLPIATKGLPMKELNKLMEKNRAVLLNSEFDINELDEKKTYFLYNRYYGCDRHNHCVNGAYGYLVNKILIEKPKLIGNISTILHYTELVDYIPVRGNIACVVTHLGSGYIILTPVRGTRNFCPSKEMMDVVRDSLKNCRCTFTPVRLCITNRKFFINLCSCGRLLKKTSSRVLTINHETVNYAGVVRMIFSDRDTIKAQVYSGRLNDLNTVVSELNVLLKSMIGEKIPEVRITVDRPEFIEVYKRMEVLRGEKLTFKCLGSLPSVPQRGFESLRLLPDVNDHNRMINSMMEIRENYRLGIRDIISNIENNHRTAEGLVNAGLQILGMNDVSFGFLDVKKGIWLKTPSVTENYAVAYNGKELVDVEGMITPGGIRLNAELKASGCRYLSVNKNTVTVVCDRLYSTMADFDLEVLDIDTEFIVYEGAPGVGKTTFILSHCDLVSDRDIILTTTRSGASDIRNRIKKLRPDLNDDFLLFKVRTGDSLVINWHKISSEYSNVENIWIDEGLMKHCGDWLWYSVLTKAKKIMVMGDSAQIPYLERSNRKVKYELYKKVIPSEIITMEISHRCPADIVTWINDHGGFYTFKVKTTSSKERSVGFTRISNISEIPFSDSQFLTFTQQEKQELMKYFKNRVITINTVHEFQGNQNKRVVLIRLNPKAIPTYDSLPHILVALTRHTEEFTYYSVVEDKVSNSIARMIGYPRGTLAANMILQTKPFKGGFSLECCGEYRVNGATSVIVYQSDPLAAYVSGLHGTRGEIPMTISDKGGECFEEVNEWRDLIPIVECGPVTVARN